MPSSNTGPCPHCQGLSIRLENLSREAIVDYYRCSKCAYVWSISKAKSVAGSDVTVPANGGNQRRGGTRP